MIHYRDRTFCGSKTSDHDCGAVITKEELAEAEKLNLPVAYSFFCLEDPTEETENEGN